jgi:diguanylate cyclase (GGDEF)-like protein
VQLDVGSILIVTIAASALVGLIISSARDTALVSGMREFGLAAWCIAFGCTFQLVRPFVPEVLSIVLGNGGMWLAVALQVRAFRLFNEPASTWRVPTVVGLTSIGVFALAAILGAGYAARSVAISTYLVVMMGLALRELFAGGGPAAERSRAVCIALCAMVLVCHVARIALVLSDDHLDTNLFHPSLERTIAFFPAVLYTLGVGMGFLMMHRERSDARSRQLALVDPLTGCANRRALEDRLTGELAFARRTKKPLSMLVVDVDHFKRVNDTHGHAIGDEVIRHVADVLRGGVRTSDVVARYGGEEFCAVLREADLEGASILAERLRAAIAGREVTVGERTLQITASIGVATFEVGDELAPDSMFRRADAALYRAKQSGRNRVEC